MFIRGLGTATPERRYSQPECLEALQATEIYARLEQRSRTLLRKLLNGSNGISGRYLALKPLAEMSDFTPDALHRRFSRHAPALATEAARRALADSGLDVADIDGVVVSTCTGYLCPGLSGYVIEGLGLRKSVTALDLVGHGCAAALPNLRAGEALLADTACRHVLSICVEVCSAAFYIDDDPGVLISACLFGDGAGAAVLSQLPAPGRRRVEWKAYYSLTDPSHRDALRFEQRHGMLRNILTPTVPKLAAGYSLRILAAMAAATGIDPRGINGWIVHAGGRDVLRELSGQLGLNDRALHWSRKTLDHYGNLSSPFVLFVLQAALAGNAPSGWWWLSSFGAGFSCHGAILSVGE